MNSRILPAVGGFLCALLGSATLPAQSDRPSTELNAPRAELDFENLHAPDINRFSSVLSGEIVRGPWQWTSSLSYTRFDVDYAPVRSADVLGQPNEITEHNIGLQGRLAYSLSPDTEVWGSSGAYDGFTGHNSIWLDEYYRQQFANFDGYVPAAPEGFSLGAGLTHNFGRWPGIVGAAVSFSQDNVAPGYDRPLFQELERGRERLYSGGLLLSLESVPFSRVRVRHELNLSDVTDRDLRWSYRGNLNVALAESWVARVEGTFTAEPSRSDGQSDFEAKSLALTVEHDWNERWFVSAHVRGYRDNGQIETSILVSAGPPPLETTQWGLALRHRSDRWSWKLGVARYETRFDEVATTIRPFGNLYRNRNWVLLDSTLSLTF